MITGLHHAQITIPKGSEAEGRAFYCGTLGLPEREKPETLKGRGGFWIRVGDDSIHIGVEDGFDRSATKAHLAYEVTDLAFWRSKIEEQNLVVLECVPISGLDRFEFRDPFGNRVEMIQPT